MKMNMIDICTVLNILFPTAKYEIGADYESLVWDDENIEKPTEEQIEAKIKELEIQALIDEKSQAIEDHIYENYPQKTQAQDNGWVTNFTTKLNAMGVKDLDKQIVTFAGAFLKGKKLKDILKDIDDAIKPMYDKLVKVAIKNEWTFLVIQEGKKAVAENRKPVYPAFPIFE